MIGSRSGRVEMTASGLPSVCAALQRLESSSAGRARLACPPPWRRRRRRTVGRPRTRTPPGRRHRRPRQRPGTRWRAAWSSRARWSTPAPSMTLGESVPGEHGLVVLTRPQRVREQSEREPTVAELAQGRRPPPGPRTCAAPTPRDTRRGLPRARAPEGSTPAARKTWSIVLDSLRGPAPPPRPRPQQPPAARSGLRCPGPRWLRRRCATARTDRCRARASGCRPSRR